MAATNSRIDLKMRLRQRMPVLVHQFTIDRNGITHTPTGWIRDSSGTITKGTDRDFDLDQVAEMGRRLWLKRLRQKKEQVSRKKRPRLPW
jgi:hypothetical protein